MLQHFQMLIGGANPREEGGNKVCLQVLLVLGFRLSSSPGYLKPLVEVLNTTIVIVNLSHRFLFAWELHIFNKH